MELLEKGQDDNAIKKALHEKAQKAHREAEHQGVGARLKNLGQPQDMSKADMIKYIQANSTVAFQRANHCYGAVKSLKGSANQEKLVAALEDLANKKTCVLVRSVSVHIIILANKF